MKKFLYFLLLIPTIFSAQISSIPSNERNALIALYKATNGENWDIKWDLLKDPKEWYGVKVENNTVTELRLNANNLKGNSPTSISSLSNLKVLDLSANNISGEVSFLSGLSNLTDLDISENNFTGDPSPYLMQLNNIENCSIGNNFFEIQDANIFLQNFQKLKNLNLSNCKLTSIPSSIASLNDLVSLDLSKNAKQGGYNFLSNLTSLSELNLSETGITEIPTEISTLQNLKVLNLSHNKILKFTPLSSLKLIEWLSLEDNNLTTLPAEISYLNELRHINLNYNSIKSFSVLLNNKELQQIFINNNGLEGGFPSEILALEKLQMISLNNNNLTGDIPNNIPEITLLQNNRYTKTSIEKALANGINYINFDYSPQRYDEKIDVYGELENSISLNQELTAAEGYQFQWLKNLDSKLFSNSESHYISNIQEDDYTSYTCEAYYLKDLGENYFELSLFREPITLMKNTSLATPEADKPEINIYPNPTSDYLNISMKKMESDYISIYDASGKLIMTTKEIKINVSALPQALYFLNIKTKEGKVHTFKFIKK